MWRVAFREQKNNTQFQYILEPILKGLVNPLILTTSGRSGVIKNKKKYSNLFLNMSITRKSVSHIIRGSFEVVYIPPYGVS